MPGNLRLTRRKPKRRSVPWSPPCRGITGDLGPPTISVEHMGEVVEFKRPEDEPKRPELKQPVRFIEPYQEERERHLAGNARMVFGEDLDD